MVTLRRKIRAVIGQRRMESIPAPTRAAALSGSILQIVHQAIRRQTYPAQAEAWTGHHSIEMGWVGSPGHRARSVQNGTSRARRKSHVVWILRVTL